MTFTITTTEEHIVWETRGSASASAVIEVYYHLPETLRGNLDAILKQAEEAGGSLSPGNQTVGNPSRGARHL